ncbi:MAG: TraM recognition domain-containing protein [Caldilineaceae bacterium]
MAHQPSGSDPPVAARDYWPLHRQLLHLPPHDFLDYRDVLSGGIHAWASTGGGKTSGPMATILRALLAQLWGLLILCAKDEADSYVKLAREMGRERHVVRVTPSGPWRLNLLDYELKRPGGGGQIENIVNFLTTTLTEIVEGRSVASTADPFWGQNAKVWIRNSVPLLLTARNTINLDDLSRFLRSVPESREQVGSNEWQQQSFCAQVIAEANRNATEAMKHEVERGTAYILSELASMSDRTRSSVMATLSASIDALQHGVLYQLFSTDTTFVPEILNDAAIIIVDIPQVQYGEVSRIASTLIKLVTQRALLRRNIVQHPRPVAIVCDESQNFVHQLDWEFLSMSRSVRAASIYATQGLQNYYARLGAGAEASVKALLGQFTTQIFGKNSDILTNQYAADLISRRWSTRTGSTSQNSLTGHTHSASASQTLEYPVQPYEFLTLRSGGAANDFCVDTYMVGKVWSHGEVYLRTTWKQQ